MKTIDHLFTVIEVLPSLAVIGFFIYALGWSALVLFGVGILLIAASSGGSTFD